MTMTSSKVPKSGGHLAVFILTIVLPVVCQAQALSSLTNDALQSKLLSLEVRMKLDTFPTSEKEWNAKCGPGSAPPWYCETEITRAYTEVQKELRVRATGLNDPLAQSYLAMALTRQTDLSGLSSDYVEALSLFKKSCLANIPRSCYNAGVMLLEGKGGPKSPSAAIEWFYGAGQGFLNSGNRDMANAALDQILTADNTNENELGKKLQRLLRETDPK